MNSLEILRGIGEQKLHEKSHIAKKYIQSILNEEFGSMSSTQFYGFVSILQREFKLDLSDVKERAKIYYASLEPTSLKELNTLRTTQGNIKKSQPKSIYTIIIVTILVAGMAYYFSNNEVSEIASEANSTSLKSSETQSMVEPKEIKEINEPSKIANESAAELSSSAIDTNDAQEVATDIEQQKASEDIQSSVKQDEEVVAVEPTSEVKEAKKEIVITPKSRLWVGYIDMDTHKKYQDTTSDELSLDGSKEWLILLGHGNVDILTNGTSSEFKKRGSMRFIYKDGELKEITHDEFMSLNDGKDW